MLHRATGMMLQMRDLVMTESETGMLFSMVARSCGYFDKILLRHGKDRPLDQAQICQVRKGLRSVPVPVI